MKMWKKLVSMILTAALLAGMLSVTAGAAGSGGNVSLECAGSAVVEKDGGVYVMNTEDSGKVEFYFDNASLGAPVTLDVVSNRGTEYERHEDRTFTPIVVQPGSSICFPEPLQFETDAGEIGHFWATWYSDLGGGAVEHGGSSEWWLTGNLDYDLKDSYYFTYSDMGTFETPDGYYWVKAAGDGAVTEAPIAYASTQSILVDGTPVTFEAYALKDASGNDTNYIKLRDVASVLNGTPAQFEVGWDGAVNILTGQAYTPNGSEMSTPYSGNRAYETAAAETKVNGKAAALEAILIQDDAGNGYTYYKLRDLGAALGFTVDWSAEKGIFLETGDRAVLANGKDITDENIREILYGLKADYPEGMEWTNDNYYSSSVLGGGLGCAGFAFLCSDAVFGDLPRTGTHSDFDAIRVGDYVRMNNDTHSVTVLEKRADSIVVTEGNYNSSIHWGREISRKSLEAGNFFVVTRYPE